VVQSTAVGSSGMLCLILNAAERLIYQALKCDHVSSLIQELHWLSVLECIKYWLDILVFRCRA